MFIAIIGLIIGFVGLIWFVINLFKRKPAFKKLLLIPLGLLIMGYGASKEFPNGESAQKANEEKQEAVSKEPKNGKETKATNFVDKYEGKNIDDIYKAYKDLSDDNKKMVTEFVNEKDSTLFGKEVIVTGTVVEWYEGQNGFDKSSFYVLTDNNLLVRVSSKGPNPALDLTEKVELYALLASPLDDIEKIYVRDASVYIK